jgi:hypothetical protein
MQVRTSQCQGCAWPYCLRSGTADELIAQTARVAQIPTRPTSSGHVIANWDLATRQRQSSPPELLLPLSELLLPLSELLLPLLSLGELLLPLSLGELLLPLSLGELLLPLSLPPLAGPLLSGVSLPPLAGPLLPGVSLPPTGPLPL